MQSINPATNQIIKDYPFQSDAEMLSIVEGVNTAWQSWKETTFAERSTLMHKVGEILTENAEKYALTMTLEMGKVTKEAISEIKKSASLCHYYADEAEAMLQDEVIESSFSKSLVHFQPIGTIFAIMPWNFPFWQALRFAVPALMAGNTGILKHAPNVNGCAEQIEELFQLAGFPANVFRSIYVDNDQAGKVIQHPHIKAVTLTGSERAGSAVAMQAGKALKKSVLELGGSDAFIVLEDADLEVCCQTSVLARCFNAGQTCIAAKRFFIHEKIYDQFLARHKELLEALVIGNPQDAGTQVAPMAREDLLLQLDEQVQKSIQQGATLVSGGKRVEREGFFYHPTILADVKPGMTAFDEETFGPVSAIIKVKSAEEAVELANLSPYGLGGSIWTKDTSKAIALAKQMQTGGVFINSMTVSDPRLPFGGTKLSGYGRELSYYGIQEFMNIQTIAIR